jgi:hypothetical protein
LYVANPKWRGYDAETMAGKFFANLNAYTETDAKGNKLVAVNGGVHGYVSSADYVKVNGEKRAIAFYNQNGVYYADSACTIPVADFSTVGLAKRTDSTESKAMHTTVTATDDWVTVTFYIKTGSTDKNYRLEIWSGDRTGNPNAAGTYVMVDGNPSAVNNASGDYDKTLDTYGDDESVEQYKSVFSYFDTDKFLRYNKDLDTDEIGNLYKDNYNAEKQEEVIFYLHVGESNKDQKFLINYSAQDQVVTASESDVDKPTTDSDDVTTADSETNPWLLISSIAIAGVLVLAVLSIIFRKVWKKVRKHAVAKVRKPKKAKAKRVKVKAEKVEQPKEELDEDSPYND